MKKILTSFALILLACVVSNAQQNELTMADSSQEFHYEKAARPNFNEVSINYGYVTIPYLAYIFGNILGSAFIAPMAKEKLGNLNSTGAIGVEYMRYIPNGRASFGASVFYEGLKSTFVDKESGNLTRTVREHAITIMPTAKVMWFNMKHFGMYSRAGVGATAMMNDGKAQFVVALQLNPVGMDFGGPMCRGFLETGFGTQGFINAGIKACF